jgi:hypothetical protein
MGTEIKDFEVMDEEMVRINKKLTVAEKWRMASEFHRIVREELGKYIRMVHPEWGDWEIKLELARSFYGEKFVTEVFDKIDRQRLKK